jgi:hypothetical protein
MPRKCPPGVFCIENMTMGFLFMVGFFVLMYIYFNIVNKSVQNNNHNNHNNSHHSHTTSNWYNPFQLFFKPNVPYSNTPGDVYMNPYTAPLRDSRYMVSSYDIRGDPNVPTLHSHIGQAPHMHPPGVPINVPTQSVDTHYRQVGILTRNQGHQETILPLMGRPLFTNRDKWQFYTLSDKNNSVKLPVSNNGRSCTNEYGCNNLYNNDTVYVEGYNDAFKVTMYDNATVQYIPYI